VSYSKLGVGFAHYRFDTNFAGKGKAGEDGFVFGLVVGCFEGKMEGFLNEDIVRIG